MQLRRHQQENLDFFRDNPRAMSLLQYGSGKTPAAILRIADLVPPRRCLVVTTTGTLFKWVKELKLWGDPDWAVIALNGRRTKRLNLFRSAHNVAVINYEGLRVMMRLLGKRILGFYKVIVFDEIHRLKNAEALIGREAALIAHPNHCDYVYGLTGSPVLETPTDMFSIMRVINPAVFGQDYESWRKIYFDLTGEGGKYPKWIALPGATEFLADQLHGYGFRRSRDQLDMKFPDQIFAEPLVATLRDRTRSVYKIAEEQFYLALRHEQPSLRNIYPRLEKLCQISRGWAYDSKQNPILFDHWPGISIVNDYLDAIEGQGRPVFWAVRKPDFTMLGDCMAKRGMSYKTVHGGIRSIPKRTAIVDYFNKGNLDTLICHPRCVGEGIDLQANYSFRYSYRWSMQEWDQPYGRFARLSSHANWVHYTDLVVAGTIDEGIIEAIKAKADLGTSVKKMRRLPWKKLLVRDAQETVKAAKRMAI